jgi:HTH-type transcriptional regulator / antitoxin HigA
VTYGSLVAKYQAKEIATDEENDAAIAIAEELDRRQNRTLEEDALLKLLAILIERFEDEHYPIPDRTPHSMLLHLMEARDQKQEELVGVIGSRVLYLRW